LPPLRTHVVPTVGWPANGSSFAGVKIRTRWSPSFSLGRTKVVSAMKSSFATACIVSPSIPRPSAKTAS